MRPPGEIRLALRSAALELGDSGGTWRDMAQQACVGFEHAKQTARDMARAGELVVMGEARVPGVCRPMVLYAPAGEPSASAGSALGEVVRCWADFR